MEDQTVLGPLVQLPGWMQAAGWGLLSASGLLIGAVGGTTRGFRKAVASGESSAYDLLPVLMHHVRPDATALRYRPCQR